MAGDKKTKKDTSQIHYKQAFWPLIQIVIMRPCASSTARAALARWNTVRNAGNRTATVRWASTTASASSPAKSAAGGGGGGGGTPMAPYLPQMSNQEDPPSLRGAWPEPNFDVGAMKRLLDHDNHEMRDKFRALMRHPLFIPRYDLTLADERELALRRLRMVCEAGLISVLDFWNNPLRIFAAHELAVLDPAMGTKMTVQFNLFGGTVLKLGTERHRHLVEGIDSLKEVGCFGLTELGYGAVFILSTKISELTSIYFLFDRQQRR